jgi:outer membrane lipoprotein-sorting protein
MAKATIILVSSFLFFLSCADQSAGGASPTVSQPQEIMAKMATAYGQIGSYRTVTEISEYRDGQVVETRRFRYSFKKPERLRIDMESPYAGMTLVYPDENGKVAVKFGFLKLHLAPDNALLRSSAGQRIDQTDLGLLIRNISRSLTDQRHGEPSVTSQDGRAVIEVLADDHFRPAVQTLYRFSIDLASWLPLAVEELSRDGIPRRKIVFHDLQATSGVPDSFFRFDKGNP